MTGARHQPNRTAQFFASVKRTEGRQDIAARMALRAVVKLPAVSSSMAAMTNVIRRS
jgi:hypothetical protein